MTHFEEEAQIDDWFEEESKRLAEHAKTEIQKGADIDETKKKFDKAFQKLIKELPKKYIAVERYKKRQERLHTPKRRWDAWKLEKKKALGAWWKQKKEDYKKWKFEREYRKLFDLKKRKT